MDLPFSDAGLVSDIRIAVDPFQQLCKQIFIILQKCSNFVLL